MPTDLTAIVSAPSSPIDRALAAIAAFLDRVGAANARNGAVEPFGL